MPQTGSCSLTCASVAASVGLTALQLAFLNPQLTANSQRVCQVSLGQTLCRGALPSQSYQPSNAAMTDWHQILTFMFRVPGPARYDCSSRCSITTVALVCAVPFVAS